MADRNGRRYSDRRRLAGLKKKKKGQNKQPKEHAAGTRVTGLWGAALIAFQVLRWVSALPAAGKHTFLGVRGPRGETWIIIAGGKKIK